MEETEKRPDGGTNEGLEGGRRDEVSPSRAQSELEAVDEPCGGQTQFLTLQLGNTTGPSYSSTFNFNTNISDTNTCFS